MTTLFVDFENGDDNYAGSSFELLASGTDGRITGTTFSSATATFPNDGSLIDQYLSIFNGGSYVVYKITAWVSATSLTIAAISGGTALTNQSVDRQYYIGGRWKSLTSGATGVRIVPGDEIRIMGSPAPTSLGQAAEWTSGVAGSTKSVGSSTGTTPIVITSNSHGYSTGDTVTIWSHNTNTAANGTWEITVLSANTFSLDGSSGSTPGSGGFMRLRTNARVMLTTPVTANIACTGPRVQAWTAVAGGNVTTAFSVVSTTKEHTYSDQITVNTAFTTGKVAYWPLPAASDFSGYEQVSLWLRSTSITSSGQLELRLCSDASGDVVVNTILLPDILATNQWMPVTVDTGASLGSSIASISLAVNTDLSTTSNVTINLSNIIACKASSAADSLTLTSLIGKNTAEETFWGIQSINGRRVMLDVSTNSDTTSNFSRGYYGTSEAVTTWKRETIPLGPSGFGVNFQVVQDSGTAGSPITFSGGWDRTNMSTQTSETWIDGVNGTGTAFYISGKQFIDIGGKIAFVRFATALNAGRGSSAYFLNFDILHIGNCSTGVSAGATKVNLTLGTAVSNSANVINCQDLAWHQTYNVKKAYSNNSYVVQLVGTPGSIVTLEAANNGNAIFNGFSISSNYGGSNGVLFQDCTFLDSTEAIRLNNPAGPHYARNCLFSNIAQPYIGSVDSIYLTNDAILSVHNYDNTENYHYIFMNKARVTTATDERHTASGISWKIQPTSTDRSNLWPVILPLAKVACAANSLVTVKAWMRRNNSGLTMRLVCKGDQIAGVTNDVTSSISTTNDWEELTITFTPTEVGVVEITAEAWGGTTYSGWVDDLTISQA